MFHLILIAFLLGVIVRHHYHNYSALRAAVNTYIMYLGLPLLIFVSFVNVGSVDLGKVVIISVGYNVFTVALFFYILRGMKIKERTKASVFLCSTYGNLAYLGIPFSLLFFGEAGASIASVIAIVTVFFHFSFGLILPNSYLRQKHRGFGQIINPLSVGMVVALILSQVGIPVPVVFEKVAYFGTYLILFVIGLTTNLVKPSRLYLVGAAGKFIVSPIVMVTLLILAGCFNSAYYPFILLSLMPPAFVNTVLAVEYGFDKEYASGFTSVSTVLMIFVLGAISVFVV